MSMIMRKITLLDSRIVTKSYGKLLLTRYHLTDETLAQGLLKTLLSLSLRLAYTELNLLRL